QARTGADEVESRTAGARELARRRPELAGLDPRDCRGQLGLERRQLGEREPRLDRLVRTLEEGVDDFDLLRPGAEARERVHAALQPVVRVDDLLRRRLADEVRLVVDYERGFSIQL